MASPRHFRIDFVDRFVSDEKNSISSCAMATLELDAALARPDDVTLVGDAGDNELRGGIGDDRINGEDGRDSLFGDAGDDVLNGGDGNDLLVAGSGIDLLEGGFGDDILIGEGFNDLIVGGGGFDIVSYETAVAGVMILLGTDTARSIDQSSGDDTLLGVEGLIGSAFADVLVGDSGPNLLIGGAGADTLDGGRSGDFLDGGAGADEMSGGEGNDTYVVDTIRDRVLDLKGPSGGFDRVKFAMQDVVFAMGDAVLAGTIAATNIRLVEVLDIADGSGDQILVITEEQCRAIRDGKFAFGSFTVDLVIEGDGGDVLKLADAGDTNWKIVGTTEDPATGRDFTIVSSGGLFPIRIAVASAVLIGGSGLERDVETPTVGSDKLIGTTGIDVIAAGSGNDRVHGLAGKDTLKGDAGADTLIGGEGGDRLEGGDDNDVLIGGAGADTLTGGAGIDTADYSQSTTGINLRLSSPANSGGDAQGDVLGLIENAIGSAFLDNMFGDGLANVLSGRDGNDNLDGGSGNDSLNGDAGDDSLIGGLGNDRLLGLVGEDTLDGGDGADTLGGGTLATADANADSLFGGDGNDSLVGQASDTLDGGDGDDTLDGSALGGASGASVFRGGGGNDRLIVDLTVRARIEGGRGLDVLATRSGLDLDVGAIRLATASVLSGIEALSIRDGADAGSIVMSRDDLRSLGSDGINLVLTDGSVGSELVVDVVIVGDSGDVLATDFIDPDAERLAGTAVVAVPGAGIVSVNLFRDSETGLVVAVDQAMSTLLL